MRRLETLRGDLWEGPSRRCVMTAALFECGRTGEARTCRERGARSVGSEEGLGFAKGGVAMSRSKEGQREGSVAGSQQARVWVSKLKLVRPRAHQGQGNKVKAPTSDFNRILRKPNGNSIVDGLHEYC